MFLSVLFCVCFRVLLFFSCSIYVVIFSIFLGADVSAVVRFCPAQFNVTHIVYICKIIFEQINDDAMTILSRE